MARRAFLGLSQLPWAGCGPQGEEKGGPAGPGRGPCGPLSANAAMFSGVSRLRRGPSRISLPVGRFPAGFSPGPFPPFCPESPTGPFFSLRRLQGKGLGGKGPHRGFLWPPGACPGPFSPLCRRGRVPFPVFTPPAVPVDAHPFCPERPVGPFSPSGGSQEVSWGERHAHGLPVAAQGMPRAVFSPLPPGSRLFPGFHPPAGPGSSPPLGSQKPVEPFSALEWLPRGYSGLRACTRASCGRPDRPPPSALRPGPFLRSLPGPGFFCTLI